MFYFYYSTKNPSLLHVFGAILAARPMVAVCLGPVVRQKRTYVLSILYHRMADFVTSLWLSWQKFVKF